MMVMIPGVLSGPELEALSEAAAALSFEDGGRTAGALARGVKNNAQAAPGPARDAVLRKVAQVVGAHPEVQSVARPKGIARLLVSRYAGGQSYGFHVDDAIMDGARTDLSFTLCLTPPDAYAGGELIVRDGIEDRAFKPDAGGMILYPSDTLHRVAPVTDGVRLAIVGWITSRVRDPQARAILTDLDRAVAHEQAAGGDAEQLARLARSRSNLLRMWAE